MDRDRVKISAQSELRISRNIKKVKWQNEERGNWERQNDISNLGGALAPPKTWEPRTRGETLLPSREKVKEEEEEGGLSPPCFRWHRNAAGGHHHHRDLHQHLHHLHQHLHHLPPSIYSGPHSHNPMYPLLEHGALCFILLFSDVLPSYDVWVDFRCPTIDWWIDMIGLNCLWLCCCPLVPIIWACAWITL